MWTINNGILQLTLSDGNIYTPSAKEIYAQISKNEYEHNGVIYEPLSVLNLRFSGLVAHLRVEIQIKSKISIHLLFRNCEVSIHEGKFMDYIISNGVWKYLDPSVEIINNILTNNNILPSELSYSEYIVLIRELQSNNIEYSDSVSDLISEIRTSEEYIVPEGLQAKLFPYQVGGSKWLEFMTSNKCGCLLGDEMGLGKTLQIITLMGSMKERLPKPHFLVVCPLSLLENWKREIEKFYPELSVNIHYGAKRTGDYRELLKYDVNIMSYGSTITDAGMLTMIQWNLLVIDEAQNIKNPNAKRTKAVKRIKCDVPVAVTGTPFENHMTDIWSLIDYVLPGFLGSLHQFEENFTDDVSSAVKLEKLITPLILRRRVADVAKDLPERIDIPQPIIMTDEEALLYEESRKSDEPHEELKNMHIAKIQKLRTFCTHPCVYDPDYSNEDPSAISNKYSRLCEILEEIFLSNEKVVIFTSFRKMIETICRDIRNRFGVYTNFIDGSVPAVDRQKIVDEFSLINGAGLLVLNPKAAGAGLNITCANHAIHYNLEWNPAIEDQASARIYRRGQNKTVFVYRLYYVNTIEEIINDRIQKKRTLSENAIIGTTGENTDQEYILKALEASPYKNSTI
jgi:SNF2 family DNA or RNA helicase